MNCYLEARRCRKEWGRLHLETVATQMQTGTLASHVVFSFFFFPQEKSFFWVRDSPFFFSCYSASATFIPPQGFPHLLQENYVSPRCLEQWVACGGAFIHSVHVYYLCVLAAPQGRGAQLWMRCGPGLRELCPPGRQTHGSKWLEVGWGLCGRPKRWMWVWFPMPVIHFLLWDLKQVRVLTRCSKPVGQIYHHKAGLEMKVWTWVWDSCVNSSSHNLSWLKDSFLIFQTNLPKPMWSNWRRHHWILQMGWAGDLRWSSTSWAGENPGRDCWLEGVGIQETEAFCVQGPQSIDCCCCSVTKSCPTLPPHGLQHARLPCPSPSPGVYPSPCPLNQWCYPTISSSISFFSCLQSFLASGSFPISQLLASDGQSIGASASVSVFQRAFRVDFL